MFRQSKKLWDEIMSLSNLFSNELNNFININDKGKVMKPCLNENATNFYLSVINNSEVKKQDTKKIKVISHSKIE